MDDRFQGYCGKGGGRFVQLPSSQLYSKHHIKYEEQHHTETSGCFINTGKF